MFGYPKWKLDVLERRIDDFENSMRGWWEKQEALRKKVNGLYEKDIHDTERPKVDILYDEVWAKIIELEEKK